MFNKKKPEGLTDAELQTIVDRLISTGAFRYRITDEVRHAIVKDIDTRQIVVDKVNTYLNELFTDEDNLMKIKEAVIRQIDELHNVKILLDRISHHEGDQQ